MSTESAESVAAKMQALNDASRHTVCGRHRHLYDPRLRQPSGHSKLRLNTYGIIDVGAAEVVPAVF